MDRKGTKKFAIVSKRLEKKDAVCDLFLVIDEQTRLALLQSMSLLSERLNASKDFDELQPKIQKPFSIRILYAKSKSNHIYSLF